MEKIKLCEICGKEVVKGRDKYLNMVNKYYHYDCLDKQKTIVKEVAPTYSEEQIAMMTFEEKLAYLDQRIKNLTSKYNIPEMEMLEARIVLRLLSQKYGAAAKGLDKAQK